MKTTTILELLSFISLFPTPYFFEKLIMVSETVLCSWVLAALINWVSRSWLRVQELWPTVAVSFRYCSNKSLYREPRPLPKPVFLNLFLPKHPLRSRLSSPAPPAIGWHLVTCKVKVKTSSIHLDHCLCVFLRTAFWPKSGQSALDRASVFWWISKKKKKVTICFLSFSANRQPA